MPFIDEKRLTSRYDAVAQTFHWTTALGVAGLMSLGFYMHDLPLSPAKLQLYSWHKWVGVTVFALSWARLAWRWAHPAPPLASSVSPRIATLARAGHVALYALLLLVPLSGWLMSSAKGVQTVWFGVWPIPDLISRDKALGDLLGRVHLLLNWALLSLVAGHAIAALKHHLIDRDDTLMRMLPSRFVRSGDHP